MSETVPVVDLVFQDCDRSTARKYDDELRKRSIFARMFEAREISKVISGSLPPARRAVIVLGQLATPSGGGSEAIDSVLVEYKRLGVEVAILAIEPPELPVRSDVPIIRADYLEFDFSFEEVFRFALGPLPSWATVYCRPSQLVEPTGASWWTDDVLVADEYYGHVLRIKERTSSIVLAGLDEPYHIHLDRREFLVAHAGQNEVVAGRIRAGLPSLLTSSGRVLGRALRRPHGVFQGNDWTILADTDNHRVVFKKGHFREDAEWVTAEVDVRFPCAVYGDGDSAWIADTFHHRLINVSLGPPFEVRYDSKRDSTLKLGHPVAVCVWRDVLFVADEESRRLLMFRKRDSGDGLTLDSRQEIFVPFLGSPLGVSVNRNSKALVADRRKGCCWVFDLAHQEHRQLFGASSSDES